MSDKDEENIHISKDGIKLSYYRYVSESTPGFLFILISILYLKLAQNEIISSSLTSSLLDLKLSSDFKIVLFVILFIVALPLGGFISAISYYLFGWIEVVLLKLLIRFNLFITILPKRAYDYDMIKYKYEFNPSNFLKEGYKLHRRNEIHGSKNSKIGIKANRTFTRNLIPICIYVYTLLVCHLSVWNIVIASVSTFFIVFILGLICALELFVSHLNIFLSDYNRTNI